MQFILAILTVYGVTNIVTQGSIFEPFKKYLMQEIASATKSKQAYLSWFYKMINCPMCLGFWIGTFVGIFMGPFEWWTLIANGAIYSGTTWIIQCITQFLGQGYDPSRTLNVQFQNNLKIEKEKTVPKDQLHG